MDLTQYNSSATALPDEPPSTKLPDGKYLARCNKFSSGEYRSGGTYIEFEWEVVGQEGTGRRAWQKTTLNHPNPDRKKYGERDRDRISAAIGLAKLTDANQVVGKTCEITLKTKGEYQNVVFVGVAPVAATATMTQPPPVAQQQAQGAMPWTSSPPTQQAQPGAQSGEVPF